MTPPAVVRAARGPVAQTPEGRLTAYGWLLAGLSFLALFAATGQRSAFGAYVTPLEQAFGASRAEVSLVSTVGLIVYGLGLPLAGRLAERYGARVVLMVSMALLGAGCAASFFASAIWQLAISYGIVASLGFAGSSNVTVSVAISDRFRERRGFVMGLAVSGQAVGQMVLVPLSIFLVRTVGWRDSLLLLGLTFLLVLTPVFALWYRDRPGADGGAVGSRGRGAGGKTARAPAAAAWLEVARDPRGWRLALPYFVCGFTDIGLIRTHFIPLAEGRGFSSGVIAATISLLAAVTLGSTVATGYLTDRVHLSRLLGGIYLVRAAAIGLLYFAYTPAMLAAFAVVDGLTDLATITPTSALCTRFFGAHRSGSIFGVISLFHQFGAAAGAIVPGAIYEGTGGYEPALLLSIALLVSSAGLAAVGERGASRPAARVLGAA